MEQGNNIQRDGVRWLFCGGAGAIALCLFLFWADCTLSNSSRERRLKDTLHELRSAQLSLPSNRVDERLSVGAGPADAREEIFPVELTEFEMGKGHGHGHASAAHGEAHQVETGHH